jgi:hypothetical protein
MSKKQTGLEKFLPERRKLQSQKPVYFMLRFDRQKELMDFAIKRAQTLGVSRQSYMIALIAKDKAEQDE